jgi:hypothetical protein
LPFGLTMMRQCGTMIHSVQGCPFAGQEMTAPVKKKDCRIVSATTGCCPRRANDPAK